MRALDRIRCALTVHDIKYPTQRYGKPTRECACGQFTGEFTFSVSKNEDSMHVLNPHVIDMLEATLDEIEAHKTDTHRHGGFVCALADKDYGSAVFRADRTNLAAFAFIVKFREHADRMGVGFATDALAKLRAGATAEEVL